MITIYGIKNCSTVKKAINALDELGVSFEFYDYKKRAPTDELLLKWQSQLGDFPINPKGRTFKQHAQAYEDGGQQEKLELLKTYPSMLKRPLLEKDGVIQIQGFSEDEYKQLN